jgi:hypothetical protein
MFPFPLAAEVLKEPLELDHGDLMLSRRPGLGVDVDEGVVKRYPWIPGPWSFVDTDSPSQHRAITGRFGEHQAGKPSESAGSRGANRQAS